MPDPSDGQYVALDLETTGLNAGTDRIIEVGAVRFDRHGLAERFSSFVDPERPLPHEIQALTGIAPADVDGAPREEAVLAELASFIGERPVVGHNVRFDLGFLAAAGLHPPGPGYDTYELATMLLPGATRLDLRSMAAELDVSMDGWHRALLDAEVTAEAFRALLDRLHALPPALLGELAVIAGQTGAGEWSPASLIEGAMAPSAAGDVAGMIGSLSPPTTLPAGPLPPPLEAGSGGAVVSDEDIDALLEAAARRPELLPGFEPREGQRAMAQAVAGQLRDGGHLAIEAGTGIGKSLAYLLPGLLHAVRSGERVVVSTFTLNLQEQLAGHDLPIAATLVEEHEGLPPGAARAAVLKGRGNYLCLERWTESRDARRPRDVAEARMLARIAVWLQDTQSGDIGELFVPPIDRPAWNALSAEGTDCLVRRCPFVRDGSCFVVRARARAAAAHVVASNHALLLADAAADHSVLPPFTRLVIDEAHRLEEVATQQFSASVATQDIAALATALATEAAAGPGSGATALLRSAIAPQAEALSAAAGLRPAADAIATAGQAVQARVPDLESALNEYLEEFGERGGRERRASLTAARRTQPTWESAEEAALHVDLALFELERRLREAHDTALALAEGSVPALEELRAALLQAGEQASAMRSTLQAGVLRADPDWIAWLSADNRGPAINLAPLEVAQRLAENLYAGCDSVLATSATLRAGGSFDFSMRRLGLDEPTTLTIESPFDYRRAVLTLIVEDIPAPGEEGYQDAVNDVLGEAAIAAGGRTLALFTSHAGVRATARALRPAMVAEEISVLAHGVDGPPGRLLRTLADRPRSLVLGTAAFWEGVDVRGPTLSQIAIARLPFPVPTDPVYAGRAALYDEPFQQFALPQAMLRFRQGFGRLIRGSDERGVFLVLDRRIISRPYGQAFIEALPDCEVRRLPASEVGQAVARWLAD